MFCTRTVSSEDSVGTDGEPSACRRKSSHFSFRASRSSFSLFSSAVFLCNEAHARVRNHTNHSACQDKGLHATSCSAMRCRLWSRSSLSSGVRICLIRCSSWASRCILKLRSSEIQLLYTDSSCSSVCQEYILSFIHPCEQDADPTGGSCRPQQFP